MEISAPDGGIPQGNCRHGYNVQAFSVFLFIAGKLSLHLVRRKTSSQWKLVDLASWRELQYLLLAVGLFFTFMRLYIPFFYVQTYFIQQDIMSEDLGFYLLAILNGGSFFGGNCTYTLSPSPVPRFTFLIYFIVQQKKINRC